MPDIEAHITGTVWKIECEVGDEVHEGDTVVILESMKMEMPVEAEDEGTVKEILCEEGDFGSTAFFLVSGKVNVFISSRANKRFRSARAGASWTQSGQPDRGSIRET